MTSSTDRSCGQPKKGKLGQVALVLTSSLFSSGGTVAMVNSGEKSLDSRVSVLEAQRVEDRKTLDEIRSDVKELLRLYLLGK